MVKEWVLLLALGDPVGFEDSATYSRFMYFDTKQECVQAMKTALNCSYYKSYEFNNDDKPACVGRDYDKFIAKSAMCVKASTSQYVK